MAAFANDLSHFDPAPLPQPSNPRHKDDPSDKPLTQERYGLPEGPCNYRDLGAGPKPPSCGCRRFWLLSDIGRTVLDVSQLQEPWCACGHHACFHDKRSGSKGWSENSESSLASKKLSTQGHETLRHRQTAPTQPWPERPISPLQNPALRRSAAPPLRSGLPSIPSFHLTSSELRGYTNYNGSVGLGLDFRRGIQSARLLSQSPTVADADELPAIEPLPSTRQASTEDHISPSGAFMRHILEERHQTTQLNTHIASNVPVGLTDLIQSATEAATPSISASEDVTGAGQLIQEAADIVNDLERGVEAAVRAQARPIQPLGSTNHSQDPAMEQVNQEMFTGPSNRDIQNALRDIPSTLQRLAPLLNSLQTQLWRNPDISIHESINSLIKRMDALENCSFNQLPPEQIHEQFQHMDVRLSDLEARTDEHGRLISAFDGSSHESQAGRKKVFNDITSFASNISGQSLHSATSSALIAAAIDRVEAEGRLTAVEERLTTLEGLQTPSARFPWEVEIVLLPWGRNLRGIWRPGGSEDHDEWIPANDGRNVSHASISLAESGWSENAINQWASGDQDKLHARASGTNGIVYHRLKSRGLVRNVTLTQPGARDVICAVVKVFGSLLSDMSEANDSGTIEEEDDEWEPMGFVAPFIPLRKVHKSSCLKFLAGPELVTPALWSADFLSSGVMMRATGGQKRLFVTTREGYTQEGWDGWTWSSLRQLPRIYDPNSQHLSSQDVQEADALEPCWKYHPALDGIESADTSFRTLNHDARARSASRVSFYADAATKKVEPGEGDSPKLHHPITPTSEFPATQTSSQYQRKSRTLSTTLSDAALPGRTMADSLPQPIRSTSQLSKRRIRSFEQPANPSLIAALPTFIQSSAKGSAARSTSARIKKRRRITRSKSASAELATQSSGHIDLQSLHPEADPELVLKHLQDVIPNGGEIKPLSYFEPRSKELFRHPSLSIEGDVVRSISARGGEKRGVTPSAYATPYSGTVAEAGEADDDYMPSESGEDDWAGVDEDHFTSNTDEPEIDDDMSEDESNVMDGLDHEVDDGGSSDQLLEDEDDEMISSEDEIQLL